MVNHGARLHQTYTQKAFTKVCQRYRHSLLVITLNKVVVVRTKTETIG